MRRFLVSSLIALVASTGTGHASQDPGAAQETPPRAETSQEPVVRRILVEGHHRYSEGQIVSALGQGVGYPLDRTAIDRGIALLWRTFHVLATVDYRPVPDGVELLVRVEEQPLDLEPRFTGNVEIDDDELREWAGLRAEEELYVYQAPRIRERLLQRYRDEGFYFVDVQVVERPGGVDETGRTLAPDVIFRIEEGPQVRVRRVVIDGNESFPNRRFLFYSRGLSKLAQTALHGPRLFGLFASKFVEDALRADVLAMREVYRDNGYLNAVVELDRLEFSEDREWVTIHIAVDEGQVYRVGSISIQAFERSEDPARPPRPAELVVPEDELRAELTLAPGDPYTRRALRHDERALALEYSRRGHLNHRSVPAGERWEFLDPELVYEPGRPVVHVTYRIAQGRQQFIREIRITGNLHTQDRVIRRLITVEPGDLADEREIESSRRRIQATGFFSSERRLLEHHEPDYRFVPTDDPNWKDLEYFVEEGDVLTFQISGGVSSNGGAFGILSMTQRNFDVTNLPDSLPGFIDDVAERRAFHGAGQELKLQASPGTRVSFFDVYFREPDIFGLHQDRISLALNANKRLRNYEGYDEERDRYSFQLARQLGPDGSIFLEYGIGSVEVDDVSTGGEPGLGSPLAVPQLLKDQEGKNDLASLEVGYRYSDVDNRISPRNGVYFSASSIVYDELIGSDFEFVTTEVRFDLYDEFDEEAEVSDRWHVGLRGGVSVPYGASDDVPYTERFFLGGQRLLRGFDFRGVGPNENGLPKGGETYLYGTLEIRHPLLSTTQPGTYNRIEQIHGGVFLDAGVLDPDAFEVDFGETRVSAGLLFGISVPIPITFSFGFALVKSGSDDTQLVGFSIGF